MSFIDLTLVFFMPELQKGKYLVIIFFTVHRPCGVVSGGNLTGLMGDWLNGKLDVMSQSR
jgi:hypothetical protein